MLPHVRVLNRSKIDPDVRVVVPEQGSEVHLFETLKVTPQVRARERLPRVRGDGVRRRSEGEHVQQHGLIVTLVFGVAEPSLGLHGHRDQR